MTTLTISLPDSLKAFIDSQLAAKGFGNVSDYVHSLLRDAQAKEEDARLEALLLEGLASKPLTLDEAFWMRLEAKTEAIIDKHGASKARRSTLSSLALKMMCSASLNGMWKKGFPRLRCGSGAWCMKR